MINAQAPFAAFRLRRDGMTVSGAGRSGGRGRRAGRLTGGWGRAGPRRILAIAAAAVLTAASAAGCGLGGNKSETCRDATRAFRDFNQRVATASPNDATAWNRATKGLANDLKRLSGKSSDGDLKKALADMSSKWNRVQHGSGDSSTMQAELSAQPKRLRNLCA